MTLDVVRTFTDRSLYDHAVDSVRVIETHISWVFLTGRYVYKVKKPVRLPFVDFSSLDARRESCETELTLNRRLAPELYIDVVAVGGTADAPRLSAEPALEYAVKMRQFDADARLDEQLSLGRVGRTEIEAFAVMLAEFHASLPPAALAFSGEGREAAAFEKNLQELGDSYPISRAENGADTGFSSLKDRVTVPELALTARRRAGKIRECHGDLHVENCVVLNGRITAFDALEFDEALRTIDVIDEVAFLFMDLLAHGHRDLAYAFVNRYLEVTGDYDGLRVLEFYVIHRALVRAKVHRLLERAGPVAGKRCTAADYITTADAQAVGKRPTLIITHGFSGSGKTFITDELITALPAVRVRSDLERKRLHGLAATADSGSGVGTGLYTVTGTDETYAVLLAAAEAGLAGGSTFIVDASFLRHDWRSQFRQLADSLGVGFAILDCRAPVDVLERRIASRRAGADDASEATFDVLEHQLATHEPLTTEESRHALTVEPDTDLETIIGMINR